MNEFVNNKWELHAIFIYLTLLLSISFVLFLLLTTQTALHDMHSQALGQFCESIAVSVDACPLMENRNKIAHLLLNVSNIHNVGTAL